MGVGDVLKVILLLIGFCSLLFLTYVTTRFIGGKQNKAMKGKNISIIETLSLGMDKRVHLIKAGNQYVLIASTSKTIEFLTVVNLDDSIPEQETLSKENGSLFDFKSLFEKYASAYRTKKRNIYQTQEDESRNDISEGRDFKFHLNRLRTIVQKNEYQVKENGDDGTSEN